MIKSFADRRSQELYVSGKVKNFPLDVAKRAARKLEYVDLAARLDDLKVPPAHCVNIEWDTSHSEFSVEFEGEEEHHDTKTDRQNQRKWSQPKPAD